MKDVAGILPRIVGPFPSYCCACGMQPEDAYVTTPLIGIGIAPLQERRAGSETLSRIVAFDRAEASAANITQTNLVTVSSFNGPQGLLWGYDLLPQPLVAHPLASDPRVRSAQPLMDATAALYGTIAIPRFPIMPGQHVLCAYKTGYQNGPCVLYGALAVAIAADRQRNADLFLEDHGTLADGYDEESSGEGNANGEAAVLQHLIDAVDRIGDNLRVEYSAIFVGFRACPVQAGEVGCVLTAAPYVHLARSAVPYGQLELLPSMSLGEWQRITFAPAK